MYFKAIVTLFLLFVLSSSFAGKKGKTVGVYDRDSLQNEVPRLKKMQAALDAEKRVIDSNHVQLYVHLADMRSNFFRDSAKMSPIVKELKLQQIQEMRLNIAQFSQYANEEIKGRYQELNREFDNIFSLAAMRVQQQTGLDTLLDKKQLIQYKKLHSPVKAKNVSKEMRSDLEAVK